MPPARPGADAGAPAPTRASVPSAALASSLLLVQAQAELLELALDLVDGLLPEVADVHELGLALLHELPDRVHTLALQAVVGTDREVELLDRDGEIAGELGLVQGRAHGEALGLGQLGEQADQLEERRPGGPQGFARG